MVVLELCGDASHPGLSHTGDEAATEGCRDGHPQGDRTRATLPGHDGRLTNVQVDQAELMSSMVAEPTRLRLFRALRDCKRPNVQQRDDGRAHVSPVGWHVLRLLAEALAQADHNVSGLT